jgi:hypothetical protein
MPPSHLGRTEAAEHQGFAVSIWQHHATFARRAVDLCELASSTSLPPFHPRRLQLGKRRCNRLLLCLPCDIAVRANLNPDQ